MEQMQLKGIKKHYSKEDIKNLLESNNNAVLKGVVAIYNYQTKQEQDAEVTDRTNGVGFNHVDAEIMTSFAKQINAGRVLTVKQYNIAKKKIMKYAGQLAKISNGEM